MVDDGLEAREPVQQDGAEPAGQVAAVALGDRIRPVNTHASAGDPGGWIILF